MKLEYGFDLYPPLRNNAPDSDRWDEFLSAVLFICRYTHGSVELQKALISAERGSGDFMVEVHVDECPIEDAEDDREEESEPEGPRLQRVGWRFRRFSDEVAPGSEGEEHITKVAEVAKEHFGAERVFIWRGAVGRKYDASEVEAAAKQLKAPEPGHLQADSVDFDVEYEFV
jgi:hypothetical protein